MAPSSCAPRMGCGGLVVERVPQPYAEGTTEAQGTQRERTGIAITEGLVRNRSVLCALRASVVEIEPVGSAMRSAPQSLRLCVEVPLVATPTRCAAAVNINDARDCRMRRASPRRESECLG